MPILSKLLIFVVALAGFVIAFYIHRHKRHARPLVCPMQSDCEVVVHSEYSVIFGLPLEKLGMLYYGLVALSYGVFIFITGSRVPNNIFSLTIITASVAAFLLSIYLTYIQAVKLKEWCTWCLFSALCSTIIFLAAIGLQLLR